MRSGIGRRLEDGLRRYRSRRRRPWGGRNSRLRHHGRRSGHRRLRRDRNRWGRSRRGRCGRWRRGRRRRLGFRSRRRRRCGDGRLRQRRSSRRRGRNGSPGRQSRHCGRLSLRASASFQDRESVDEVLRGRSDRVLLLRGALLHRHALDVAGVLLLALLGRRLGSRFLLRLVLRLFFRGRLLFLLHKSILGFQRCCLWESKPREPSPNPRRPSSRTERRSRHPWDAPRRTFSRWR